MNSFVLQNTNSVALRYMGALRGVHEGGLRNVVAFKHRQEYVLVYETNIIDTDSESIFII